MISRRGITFTLLVTIMAGAGLLIALLHIRSTLITLDRENQALAKHVRLLAAAHSSLLNEIARNDSKLARQGTEPPTITKLQAALADVIAARKSNPSPPPTGQPYPRSNQGDIFPELLADPEYLRHTIAYEQRTIEWRYAEFFATTSARPEAVEKLRHALLQRAVADLERDELIAKHGVPAGERGELSHLLAQKFDAEAHALLGATGYAEFQRHEQTLPQRTAVAAFAERLSYAEETLDRAQAAALVALMASATEPFGTRQIPAHKFTEEVIARAKSVLSPPQWEELRRFQRELDAVEQR